MLSAHSEVGFPPLITIIDDEMSSAVVARDQIEYAGFKTRLVTDGAFERVEDLLGQPDYDWENTSVLCDHRLRINGLARFDGAEFIASLYTRGIPAVLLTQYHQDADSSIRLFRHKIPSLLQRDQITPESLIDGLSVCWNELHNEVLPTRVGHRSLVEIVELTNEAQEVVADAFVPGWSPNTSVRFPLKLVPESLQRKIKKTTGNKERAYLFASVNIGAEKSEDLFFKEFEDTPDTKNSVLDEFVISWQQEVERAQMQQESL